MEVPYLLFSDALKNNRDFLRIYNRGKNAASPLLVMYCRRNKAADTNRVGITVSTKIGKAVVRNHIRRRLREIYRLNEQSFKRGFDIVIVARQKSRSAEYAEMEKEFLYLAMRLGLLMENNEESTVITD